MTYDVATHPALSPAAVALRDADGGSASEPSGAFLASGDLAERLLGLSGTAFAGGDLETARLAVALQVGYQADQGGARAVKSETRGERRVEYAAPTETLHPSAKALASGLLDSLGGSAPAPPRRSYGTGTVRTRSAWGRDPVAHRTAL